MELGLVKVPPEEEDATQFRMLSCSFQTHHAYRRCRDALSDPRQHPARDDDDLAIGIERILDEGLEGGREAAPEEGPIIVAARRRCQKRAHGTGRDECKAAKGPSPHCRKARCYVMLYLYRFPSGFVVGFKI